ncbi:SOS response-associated peptidase family protein [Aurantibacter crassamenti]|uniref:SOS response-associated peptidase n=1 Tax=Aurantibacter crassamenti TaxID=1837375 RepID=UPI001939FC2E|nr:SOS response-associated peptidase family protein [Aurantibacter crassamenti]MBM1104585.1 SOS response-associated peptidase family protein [Aurantibacter crassamenti]
MYYKLSNTAELEEVVRTFERPFKYPNLYAPEVVIFGLNEVTLPVITIENSQEISLAIWGMLPTGYKEDWPVFQSVTNTLNLSQDSIEDSNWQSEAFRNRRCLIVVNGFFTSYFKDGKVQPHYVSLKSKRPFTLAGLYNHTEDGFLSCSLLLGKAKGLVKQHQNLSNQMPLIIEEKRINSWLDETADIDELNYILKNAPTDNLNIHPIAADLFNQDISYDAILDPIQN